MKLKVLDSFWEPATVASSKMMVVLHGRGDSYEGFQWLPSALNLPGVNYLMVNAPDPYYTGFSWYDLPPRQGPGILRSRNLLDQVFGELLEKGVDPQEVMLFGFSQGCLMSLEWGGRSSLNLAGILGISGYVYDAAKLSGELSPEARKRRWLVTHGTMDEVLDCHTTDRQIRLLQEAGLPIEYHHFRKGHTIDPGEELRLIRRFTAETLRL
jgi:phospholipase/carboxylesterase